MGIIMDIAAVCGCVLVCVMLFSAMWCLVYGEFVYALLLYTASLTTVVYEKTIDM